jgi:expansin (peptidoglycan-binding protein)
MEKPYQRVTAVSILLLFLVFFMALPTLLRSFGLQPRAYLPTAFRPANEPIPFGPTHSGEGTYYDADGTGNCGFPASPENLMVAAMNHTDYNNAALCGAYVQVMGPQGSVIVRIVDRCPNCPQGDVDLSPQAFAQIAALAQGRVPVTWQLVSYPVEGPVVYHFKEGSNQWWTAVQIRNHRNPVAQLEYWNGSQWINAPRQEWNYFLEEAGMGLGPYTFRLTDVLGYTLVDSNIPHVENGSVPGTAQFPPP